ncbi:MAG: class B sortase [Ruminococcaceae bacterium]|nr:class B sortase [Oscillospiraceae bacterium]
MSEHQNNTDRDAFARSVTALTPDDIPQKNPKKRSTADYLFNHIRVMLLLICGAILVWSLGYIFDTLKQYDRTDQLYDGLGDMIANGLGVEGMFASPSSPTTPDYDASQKLSGEDIEQIGKPSEPVNKEFERMRNILLGLKSKYPDLYGWIVLPGTVINYPVMQSTDNDYYLDHAYNGDRLAAGAIYVDYHCKKDLWSNYNLVVYGHHMTNGTMFNSLDKFFNESFFRTNNTVYFYTLDGMFTYEVFSFYETNMYYPYIRTIFPNYSTFKEFSEEMRDNSIFEVEGLTFGDAERMLTLSTCNNRTDEGRLAVHAILVDAYLAPS